MKKISYGFVIITLLCIGLIIQIKPAHADSGWHGSYGGSSHSSSRYHSSNRHHSSGSSSSSGGMTFVLTVVIIFGIYTAIIVATSKKRNKELNAKISFIPAYNVDKIKEVLPNFNKEEFRMQVFAMYKKIEVAWMNFDYETLRKYTTDELYNQYHSQLVALNVKKQKNMMKDFELKAFEVVDMERVDNTVALKVRMTVECFDYVVDKNNKVVRGTDKNKLVYNYEMTFVKGTENKTNKCPNCNAPLENVNSSVCPYCDSIIVSGSHDWVLSKKQMIHQSRK